MTTYSGRFPIIRWKGGEKDLAKHLSPEYMKQTLESGIKSAEYMYTFSIVYNMCTQKPPYNYSAKLYDYMNNVFDELTKYFDNLINEHYDKHNIDIQKSFKLCVMWDCNTKLYEWIDKFFSFLNRVYIKYECLPTIKEGLYARSKNHYNVSEDQIVIYEKKWKLLFKAQQRLQLSRIGNISYDLYESIAVYISERKSTKNPLFRSINIEIDESRIPRLNRKFKLI